MFSLLVVGAALIACYFLLHSTVLKIPRCKSLAKLHGKTVIVTGANTGIGRATALDLARRGAKVILACRDQQRAKDAIQEIVQKTGNKEVVFMQLDLASLQSVRSFAQNFLQSESRLDLLINNAGVMMGGKTVDGFGMNFGINHLGHFLLTLLLLDRLKSSGPSRVVTLSSKAYTMGRLDFGYLSTHKDVSLGESDQHIFLKYSHSKLCNVLFTYHLAKLLQGTQVTCYCVHPGIVKTEIVRHTGFLATRWARTQPVFAPIRALLFTDAMSGAQTTLHCALEQGIEHLSGHFFSDCSEINIRPHARDDVVATKLWELSEKFCDLQGRV